MTEQGPRKHANAMERAAHLEKRAESMGISVAKLLSHANICETRNRHTDSRKYNRPQPNTVSMLQLAEMDGDDMSHIPPKDLSLLREEPEGSIALEVGEALASSEERLVVPGLNESQVWK